MSDPLPCGHPAACVMFSGRGPGATNWCGWCNTESRLAAESQGRAEAEAERDAALAQVERMRGALHSISRCDRYIDQTDHDLEIVVLWQAESAREALSETPAATLEARDRGVAAKALEEAADDWAADEGPGVDNQWLRDRARLLREGLSPGRDTP